MAEASFVRQENKICPFFLNSNCRYGDGCRFVHSRPENPMCRYYQEGRCKFGDSCWFRHGRAESNAVSAAPIPRSVPFHVEYNETKGPPHTDSSRKEAHQFQNRFAHHSKGKLVDRNLSNRNQPTNWINAPEFVPRTMKSYADTLRLKEHVAHNIPDLCYDFMDGRCLETNFCPYVHGDLCEICRRACLNPFDPEQKRQHIELCEKELEQDMEYSFAVQRSEDKTCGICMDVVLEKDQVSERRFGILENCNHIFCFSCLMKWRKVKNRDIESAVDPTLTKSCPECRVPSNFITPSMYWFDSEDDKKKMIADYKTFLSKRPCKFFKQGQGECPFGGLCYYLHALPNGKKVNLPPPQQRARFNDSGELDIMSRILLLDFFSARDSLGLENILLDSDFEFDDDDEDLSYSSDAEFSIESFEI